MFNDIIDKMVIRECESENNGWFSEYTIDYEKHDSLHFDFVVRGEFYLDYTEAHKFVKMIGYIDEYGPTVITVKPCKSYAD